MSSYRNTLVASAHDATILIEACRIGLIPPASREVDMAEKSSLITSGSAFVFEDEDNDKIHRWVDGRKWSKSRIHGPFLVYEEKKSNTVSSFRDPNDPSRPERMIKKAVSVRLENGQRFHLICYHLEGDVPFLISPSADPFFKNLHIEIDLYPPMTRQGIYGKEKHKFNCEEVKNLGSIPPVSERQTAEVSDSFTPNSHGANSLVFEPPSSLNAIEEQGVWQSRVDALFTQTSNTPTVSGVEHSPRYPVKSAYPPRKPVFLSYDRWRPSFRGDQIDELNRLSCRYLVHYQRNKR